MIALVCDTPYQLMSAIMASREIAPDERMVFFINRYLYWKNQDFEYSKSHPLVENILYYGKAQMSPKKLLPGLFKPQIMLNSIEGYDPEYRFTRIIASRTAYMATYLMKAAHRQSFNIPVYIIEEGADEYSVNFSDTRFTKTCRVLRQKTHIDCVESAYFSAPQLYPHKLSFPVKKVPAPDKTAKEIITSVFNLEDISENNPFDPYKCIILSQPVFNEYNPDDTDEIKEMLSKVTEVTANSAGVQNTVVKAHPLDPIQTATDFNTFSSRSPMEALLLNLNADSKFFVSAISTAMLTPKLLFDYEPGLIFTYKILDSVLKKTIKNYGSLLFFYKLSQGVMDSYRDKSRCAVPETIEELEETVLNFSERFSQQYN